MWINHDTKNHRLVSGNPDTLISDGIFDTGEILVGQTSSIQFNSSQRAKSIPYFCVLHPNERGAVIILPIEEDSLTNEERLELLESTFVFDNSAEFKKMHTSLEKICGSCSVRANTRSGISNHAKQDSDYRVLGYKWIFCFMRKFTI
jgi:hypothetical protein